MTAHMEIPGLTALLIALTLSPVGARGRQPEDQDNYPDYNRLEIRKKAPDLTAEPSAPSPANVSLPAPPVNPPPTTPKEPEAQPKPPPTAVPMPAEASEPALPDDMLKTLTPGTTGQKL